MRNKNHSLQTHARGGKAGFSIVEVMIALGVFAIALVSLCGFLLKLNDVSGESYAQSLARSHAVEQLEEVRRQPYSQIQPESTVEIQGLAGFTRSVSVQRIGGPTAIRDYKIITVDVQPPGDIAPVRLTTAIAAE